MRLIFSCLLLMLGSIICFSQVTKEELLTKSNNQRTAARVMLVGGVVMTGIGLVIGNGEEANLDQAATGGVIVITGIASCIGSIPLFIASKRNKRKGLNLSAGINIEGTYPLTEWGPFPAFAIKIKL